VLRDHDVEISMDGRGRWLDNVFIERLWRSVKHDDVYLKAYENLAEARRELGAYFDFYNHRRRHQGLGDRTPGEVYSSTLRPQQAAARRAVAHLRALLSLSYPRVVATLESFLSH